MSYVVMMLFIFHLYNSTVKKNIKPIKTVQFSGEVLHLCFLKTVDHICCWGDYNFGCIISGVGTLFELSRAAHNGLHRDITELIFFKFSTFVPPPPPH